MSDRLIDLTEARAKRDAFDFECAKALFAGQRILGRDHIACDAGYFKRFPKKLLQELLQLTLPKPCYCHLALQPDALPVYPNRVLKTSLMAFPLFPGRFA